MTATLGPLEGEQIPGGCDDCDAYQTVEPMFAGAWWIVVHHDSWCPFYARVEQRRRGARGETG